MGPGAGRRGTLGGGLVECQDSRSVARHQGSRCSCASRKPQVSPARRRRQRSDACTRATCGGVSPMRRGMRLAATAVGLAGRDPATHACLHLPTPSLPEKLFRSRYVGTGCQPVPVPAGAATHSSHGPIRGRDGTPRPRVAARTSRVATVRQNRGPERGQRPQTRAVPRVSLTLARVARRLPPSFFHCAGGALRLPGG